jgi:hypothetical protein
MPATCFMLVSCMDYSSTLKMEMTCSSKTSVEFQQTIGPYNPKDRTLEIITHIISIDYLKNFLSNPCQSWNLGNTICPSCLLLLLVSCMVYSSTKKMETACPSERVGCL